MDFKINTHTEYLVVSGSHSYGLSTDSSDYDLRGWCIPPLPYFLTFDKKFDQHDKAYKFVDYPFHDELMKYVNDNKFRIPSDDEEIDQTVYSIHKFFKLAADCNPNIIELLYVEPSEILLSGEFGSLVRNHRSDFLSARAKHTFTGYAVSQLKRINTHRRWLLHPPTEFPKREDFGLGHTSLIPADQRGAIDTLVEKRVREWMLQEEELDKTDLSLMHDRLKDFISAILSEKDFIIQFADEQQLFAAARLAAMRQMGLSTNYIAIVQAEKKYRAALLEWQQYEDWKATRNQSRAELEAKFMYDTKHGSHLVRLLNLGRELLTTGEMHLKGPATKMAKEVREGLWSYEKLIDYLEEVDKELDTIYKSGKYVVPKSPNMSKLSELCMHIVNSRWHTRVTD